MSVLQMTRSEIITQGLSLAGRSDLISDARLWLSLFLEEMYLNQDFDWLIKASSGLAVSNGTAVPEDYRASKSAVLIDSNGTLNPIKVLTKADEIDSKRAYYGDDTGSPEFMYVDQNLRTFNFLPTPNTTYTMDLKYYYVPYIGEYSTSYDDDDVPKWGLPFSILIDHIKSRAMEYNDDQRQEGAAQKVQSKIAEAKVNNHDRRAGPSRMQLGPRFRKRF